jgi:hypothetical protein
MKEQAAAQVGGVRPLGSRSAELLQSTRNPRPPGVPAYRPSSRALPPRGPFQWTLPPLTAPVKTECLLVLSRSRRPSRLGHVSISVSQVRRPLACVNFSSLRFPRPGPSFAAPASSSLARSLHILRSGALLRSAAHDKARASRLSIIARLSARDPVVRSDAPRGTRGHWLG